MSLAESMCHHILQNSSISHGSPGAPALPPTCRTADTAHCLLVPACLWRASCSQNSGDPVPSTLLMFPHRRTFPLHLQPVSSVPLGLQLHSRQSHVPLGALVTKSANRWGSSPLKIPLANSLTSSGQPDCPKSSSTQPFFFLTSAMKYVFPYLDTKWIRDNNCIES
jgi:hypothetical protein